MAKPNEKLASSLAALHDLQKEGQHIFRTGELSRVHRDRLVKSGFLQPVIKGWLMSVSPSVSLETVQPGSHPFGSLCAAYCTQRFGANWHLSPEQSLLLHAENTVVPAQTIVYSRKGHNNTTKLPFHTSLYDLKQSQLPPRNQIVVRDGLRLFSRPMLHWCEYPNHSSAATRSKCK